MNKGWDVTISAAEPRIVVCEECEAEYVYILEVSGTGSAGAMLGFKNEKAKTKAEKKAKDSVRSQLKTEAHAVPCPECAHYQDHMISVAKWQHVERLVLATALIGGGGLVLAFVLATTKAGEGLWLAALAFGVVVGGVLGLVSFVLYRRFEPNEQPKKVRFKIADEKAMLRDDFEEAADNANIKAMKKALNKNRGSTEVIVWIDKYQIEDEADVIAKLPNGGTAKIELDRDVRKGDVFAFKRSLSDGPMEFVCEIHIYNEYRGK